MGSQKRATNIFDYCKVPRQNSNPYISKTPTALPSHELSAPIFSEKANKGNHQPSASASIAMDTVSVLSKSGTLAVPVLASRVVRVNTGDHRVFCGCKDGL